MQISIPVPRESLTTLFDDTARVPRQDNRRGGDQEPRAGALAGAGGSAPDGGDAAARAGQPADGGGRLQHGTVSGGVRQCARHHRPGGPLQKCLRDRSVQADRATTAAVAWQVKSCHRTAQ